MATNYNTQTTSTASSTTMPSSYTNTTSTTNTPYSASSYSTASDSSLYSASNSSYMGTSSMPSSSTAGYSTTSTTYNNSQSLSAPAYDPSVRDPSPYNSPNLGPANATYTPPDMPMRPVAAVQSADIRTTNAGPDIHSTSSFTTNTGVAAQPIDMSNETLAKPSTGLVHSFKKMMLGGQTKDLEQEPMIMRADQALNHNVDGARALQGQIQRYQQAQQALQDATVGVANAFHNVLSDETNPYAGVSAELVRQSQMHSIVPAHSQQLLDLTNSAIEDTNGAYGQIRTQLQNRRTKASDVEYYRAKVAKLTTDYETAAGKGDVRPADKERLERNIGKMREIEMEYNTENERVIADINALWRRRIIRLGPALSSFLLNSELVHKEQLAMFQQLGVQVRAINPDTAHNTYLTSSATMLVPQGVGFVDNRELINQAHVTGVKGDVMAHQRHLEAERQQRHNSVSTAGGSLETVAQETIVRSEEQMRIMKERFVTERVRLRKVVTTEMVTITVPVRKENVLVERVDIHGPGIPVSASESLEEERNRSNRRKGRDTRKEMAGGVVEEEEETFEMILSEERPRVVNDVVPIERVRMRKVRQVTPQYLEMDLLKEHIDYRAPAMLPGQQVETVRVAGAMQTVSGQQMEGFTDRSNGQAQVVNRPVLGTTATTTTTGTEFVKAEVDDVEAMRRMGYGEQQGQYGQVNTVGMVGGINSTTATPGMVGYDKEPVVGTNHPYYNGQKTAPGTANTFDQMTASPDISTETTTTSRPVV